MNLIELKKVISEPNQNICFIIDNEEIPKNFYITEIGKENRVFVDCSTTKRKTEKCVLQLWVANDLEHRVDSNKLLKIINLGEHLFEHDIPDVYIEYAASQYSISHYELYDNTIEFHLTDKCGVNCNPLLKLK